MCAGRATNAAQPIGIDPVLLPVMPHETHRAACPRPRSDTLRIAHVVKRNDDEAKSHNLRPFESTFWHNSARATWYVKRAEDSADESRITIGIYNQKANTGRLRLPSAYRSTSSTIAR